MASHRHLDVREPSVDPLEPLIYAVKPLIHAVKPLIYAVKLLVYALEPLVYTDKTLLDLIEASIQGGHAGKSVDLGVETEESSRKQADGRKRNGQHASVDDRVHASTIRLEAGNRNACPGSVEFGSAPARLHA